MARHWHNVENDYIRKEIGCERMKKPVYQVGVDKMWQFEYQAKVRHANGVLTIFASDSLINLKQVIRWCGFRLAMITTNSGLLSYGQNGVNEYPYCPHYFYGRY